MLKETLDDNGFFASPSLDWGEDICFNEVNRQAWSLEES